MHDAFYFCLPFSYLTCCWKEFPCLCDKSLSFWIIQFRWNGKIPLLSQDGNGDALYSFPILIVQMQYCMGCQQNIGSKFWCWRCDRKNQSWAHQINSQATPLPASHRKDRIHNPLTFSKVLMAFSFKVIQVLCMAVPTLWTGLPVSLCMRDIILHMHTYV